ncbi:MAG: amino acid adenylation domain-containing protein [Planctomycetaceae bacterium]|nr:amino acid adenylation domain-containing protein [Planctomycetaceae bacterium]
MSGPAAPATNPPTTILDLFAEACARHGDLVALDIPPDGARARCTKTYAELDAMAEQVAGLVAASLGARPVRDAVVALALPRTDPWLYAAMLGSMRAGCAYVAIDPAFPARQAAEIVRDAAAVALVAERARADDISMEGGLAPLVTTEDLARAPRLQGGGAPAPHDLAYVIYTSGTTGRPKGVEIEHRSILNLVAADMPEFGLGPHDRIAQGSSASYDSSVEEIWLAWAVGATIVVMDDATARLGPDLVEWLVRERVTVLCPPPTLLRALACDDPARMLPAIRLLYVGGEALPQDVADLWSQGRRLENGYGPTECTVTCLRSTVRAGEPVTIGRAVPNATAHVIDPEDPALRVIDGDAQGELVVGGASLARGYRGQPETTAARFIEHPSLGRVYRTGDLVHRDARGEFHYHGRIDAQVKLRGYRIELGAIDARLAAHETVREAAATVEGEGAQRRLVAHVVLAAGAALDADALRAFVAAELPAYMVPVAIASIDALPRSIGAKLDRKRLPEIRSARADAKPHVAAVTETERAVAEAFAFGAASPVSVEADLFDDLGLDSLTVAIAVSRMRAHDSLRAATVRLAYTHRTVRGIAAAVDAVRAASAPSTRQERSPAQGTSRPMLVATAQCAFLCVMLLAASQLTWIPNAGGLVAEAMTDSPAAIAVLAAVTALGVAAYCTGAIALAALAKWVLIGRYRVMRVRAWSGFHLRHWAVVRVAALIPWDLLEVTGLAPVVLRLLGARIGRGVHIHRGVRLTDGGWDLLTLEDGATVGQDACLRTLELEAGTLVFGPVTMRRNSTLETRAGLSPGAELGEGSILRPLSNLAAGAVHMNAVLDGVPAVRMADAPSVPTVEPSAATPRRAAMTAALAVAVIGAIALPWAAALWLLGFHADSALRSDLFDGDSVFPSGLGLARLAAAVVVAGALTVLFEALLVRLLGRAPRGAYALGSFAASRMSLQSMLVESAGKWLSGTLMWPIWLNLAGARIGRGCEISTVTDVIPSTVTIGRETFFADGIYLGGPRLHAGTATIEPVELGESCFVGNHAVLPAGTRLAPGTLVGISTRGDGLPYETGASWFGHPAFRLPKREIVDMPRELTHDPTIVRRLNRWLWELARFLLPIGPMFVGLAWFRAMEMAEGATSGVVFRLVALPLGVLGALAALALAVVAMKWLLIGRVRPATHALWSCWCSRWDYLYVAWGMWASVPLGFLEGTPMLVGYLRAMGCRIGRRALLGHGFAHVVDPDMLRFGDDVTVDALFQAHTFEDRVLKVDHVDLRDGCTVLPNTVILYGAEVGAGATVAPHSVVMKRERLSPGLRYEGAPTQPA